MTRVREFLELVGSFGRLGNEKVEARVEDVFVFTVLMVGGFLIYNYRCK